MKNILLIFCLISSGCVLFSQNKTDAKTRLRGKWLVISTSGGFSGTGNGWTSKDKVYFEFKKNGQFRQTEKGKLTKTDSFTLAERNPVSAEDFKIIIDFKKNMDQVYEIKNDTLIIEDDVRDGFNYVLVKKK